MPREIWKLKNVCLFQTFFSQSVCLSVCQQGLQSVRTLHHTKQNKIPTLKGSLSPKSYRRTKQQQNYGYIMAANASHFVPPANREEMYLCTTAKWTTADDNYVWTVCRLKCDLWPSTWAGYDADLVGVTLECFETCYPASKTLQLWNDWGDLGPTGSPSGRCQRQENRGESPWHQLSRQSDKNLNRYWSGSGLTLIKDSWGLESYTFEGVQDPTVVQ